jgi:uncharacterized membrane protein
MSILYILAGLNHFVHPEFYMQIMPPWLPWPGELVLISGIAELFLGVFLLPSSTRKWAAWLIILLLIAIFPANIQMSINYANEHRPGFWLSVLRLPLQFVLIYWAYRVAKQAGKTGKPVKV